jgi:hypothetical protein
MRKRKRTKEERKGEEERKRGKRCEGKKKK